MSLSAKLIATFGTSVVITLALGIAAIWGSNSIDRTVNRMQVSEHQLHCLEQVAARLYKRHTALTRFVYAGHEDSRRDAALAGAEARAIISQLVEENSAELTDQTRLGRSDKEHHELQRLIDFRDLLNQVDVAWWNCLTESGNALNEQARSLFDEGCDKPLKMELLPRIENMIVDERGQVDQYRLELAEMVSMVHTGAWAACILGVSVAAIAILLLQKSVEAVHRMHEAEVTANATKSMFLANMSHEIRTPLNGILGFARLLKEQQGDITAPETQDFINTIHSSGSHLLNLVNDILDLSKVEAGKLECNFELHPVLPILEDVVSILRPRAIAKSLNLELRWNGIIPAHIRTDAARLKQILVNLVGNALKFTDRGGVFVDAQIKQVDESWQLFVEVVDTGIGIAEEKLDLIFHPFRQADSTVTRAYEGTGLGLSISRRLAEVLGGEIQVESAIGKGSKFSLVLDIGTLEGVELIDTPTVYTGPQVIRDQNSVHRIFKGKSILVVDDGKTNRELIRIILNRMGAEVLLAEDGVKGVFAALSTPVDAILMDSQMPIMDGLTATRRLRQQGYTGPIIALTASITDRDRYECQEAGCSGFLAKPVDQAALAEELSKQLALEKAESKKGQVERTEELRDEDNQTASVAHAPRR